MNKLLLTTSTIGGLIILYFIQECYTEKYLLIYYLITFGIISSILNHGTSNNICKYVDRITMCILTILFLFLICTEKNIIKQECLFGIIMVAMILYGYSKTIRTYNRFYMHAISHFLLVVLIYLLIV